MLIKIILIFSSPLGTLGGGEGSGEGTGVCRRRTAYLIFSNFSGEFSGRDGSFVPFATAARGSGDSAGTGGGEGGTGGGGGRAGLGGDLAGNVHLYLTQFNFFLVLGADLQPVHVVHLGDLLLDGLEVLHAVISA